MLVIALIIALMVCIYVQPLQMLSIPLMIILFFVNPVAFWAVLAVLVALATLGYFIRRR